MHRQPDLLNKSIASGTKRTWPKACVDVKKKLINTRGQVIDQLAYSALAGNLSKHM